MAVAAGYLGKVLVSSSTNPPAVTLGSVQSVDGGPSRDLINVTAIAQTSPGGEAFILGKFKGERISIKCFRDVADAGQLDLQNTLLTGTGKVYVIIQHDPSASAGARGFGMKTYIESISTSVGTDGAGPATYNLVISDKVVVDNGTIPT